jgi:uncharacterized protein (DUF302 family)
MTDQERRVVVDLPFEAALGETARAIEAEGMQVVSRIDVRDRFKLSVRREFRQYELVEAWDPREAFETLQADLDAGPTLPLHFSVYELADGETAVTTDDRGVRAGRVLGRLRRLPRLAPRAA